MGWQIPTGALLSLVYSGWSGLPPFPLAALGPVQGLILFGEIRASLTKGNVTVEQVRRKVFAWALLFATPRHRGSLCANLSISSLY